MRAPARRVLVVGLDCAPPALVFDRYASVMPTVRGLRARGAWGPLRSSAPPITIPAWACMTTGKDPGELGLHGFRSRVPGERRLRTTTADDLHAERVFDVAARAGLRTASLYVPPSFPPRAPDGGISLGCLLWPGEGAPFAAPPAIEDELRARFGPPRPDVEPHLEKGDDVLDALFSLASHHFDVAEHVLASHDPALLMLVEMATDRLHHALWPAIDPRDPRHDPASPLGRGARDLYAYLDLRIARLVEASGEGTAVFVVSDHGARPVLGGVRVNEHLRRRGWLVLEDEPAPGTTLDRARVDWSRTRAWAEGGYHARIWLNDERFVGGPVVDRAEALAALRAELATIEDGASRVESRVVSPSEIYREVRGEAPDLLAFLGDLDFRALADVGPGDVVVPPGAVEGGAFRGGCNHDWDGIFVAAGAGIPALGVLTGANIVDVGRTLLARLGLPAPEGWGGVDLLAS